MRSLYCHCVAIILLVISVVSAVAEPQRVDLEPLVHENAELVIVTRDGARTVYTPASLEGFPTYQIETTTPWREVPAVFAGVLLSDVLMHHDMLSDAPIRVTAENDFSTVFDAGALNAAPILIATRVNGAPLSRRARGPIQFVIQDEVYRAKDSLTESHLVWMAARIETVR